MAQADFRGVPVHHAEPVGQPREPPHVHPPRLVLAFDKGRGDGRRIRLALHRHLARADALGRAVAAFALSVCDRS